MELYIIRHADPDYAHNTITELGHKEAESLVPAMKEIKPNAIFCSPLGRAIETALPTCKALGLDYTILPWTAEDMAYMQMPTPGNCGGYSFNFDKGFTNVRDFSDYPERKEKLAQLKKESDAFISGFGYRRTGGFYKVVNDNDIRVAVFCHGGFGSAWIAYLCGIPPMYGWTRIRLYTTGITKFVFDGDDDDMIIPYCQYMNDNRHTVEAHLHGRH